MQLEGIHAFFTQTNSVIITLFQPQLYLFSFNPLDISQVYLVILQEILPGIPLRIPIASLFVYS